MRMLASVALLTTIVYTAPAQAATPLLASELPPAATHRGGPVEVYGRLESLVGSTIRLHGGTAPLHLPEQGVNLPDLPPLPDAPDEKSQNGQNDANGNGDRSATPEPGKTETEPAQSAPEGAESKPTATEAAIPGLDLLRAPELRRSFLQFRVHVKAREWFVIAVSRGAAPQDYYEARRAQFGEQSRASRLSVIRWGKGVVATGHSEASAELSKRVSADLSALLAEISTGPKPTVAELSRTLELIGTQRADATKVLLAIAQRHGDDSALAEILQQHQLVRTAVGWRLESEYLTQFGMKRVDDVILTVERAILMEQLSKQHRSALTMTMLRTQTSARYAEIAAKKQVAAGMTRSEVVTARGYPQGMTWVREGARFFEAWMYGDQWVCFADGYAFASS